MSESLRPVRRIVTGFDAQGRSRIIEDGPSPAVRSVPERPGYRVTNVWRTSESPVRIDAADSIADHRGVCPPPTGSVVRIIDYPPEPVDPAARAAMQEATFRTMFPDAQHHVKPGEHPGMHRTDTVDYAIVLEGEITAILEEEQTVMRAGDVMIQRGTNHAWANRSGKPARIAFILLDGTTNP